MPKNVSGNAYALTILSPIKNGFNADLVAYADVIRDQLQNWNTLENSPMALVPQTYLCRFFILDDVVNQSMPGGGALDTFSDFLPLIPNFIRERSLPKVDQLQSRYLVFSCNFHAEISGDLDTYLQGMWGSIESHIKEIWQYCYGFEGVDSADQFVKYMHQCKLSAALYFVGSNDDSLDEQLKALYLKQEFSKFAIANQGLDATTIKINLQEFMARVEPENLQSPSWQAGQYRLNQA